MTHNKKTNTQIFFELKKIYSILAFTLFFATLNLAQNSDNVPFNSDSIADLRIKSLIDTISQFNKTTSIIHNQEAEYQHLKQQVDSIGNHINTVSEQIILLDLQNNKLSDSIKKNNILRKLYTQKSEILLYILSAENSEILFQRFLFFFSFEDIQNKFFEEQNEINTKKSEMNVILLNLVSNEAAISENIQQKKTYENKIKVLQNQRLDYIIHQNHFFHTFYPTHKHLAELDSSYKTTAYHSNNQISNVRQYQTPNDEELTLKFNNAIGEIDYPIDSAKILSNYGLQTHTELKDVMIDNQGLILKSKTSNKVKVVFDGTVSKILSIPGANKAIIVRHGNYFTVYSNLATINVRVGAEVKKNQVIAELSEKQMYNDKLEFQIWFLNTHLNPKIWLK